MEEKKVIGKKTSWLKKGLICSIICVALDIIGIIIIKAFNWDKDYEILFIFLLVLLIILVGLSIDRIIVLAKTPIDIITIDYLNKELIVKKNKKKTMVISLSDINYIIQENYSRENGTFRSGTVTLELKDASRHKIKYLEYVCDIRKTIENAKKQ